MDRYEVVVVRYRAPPRLTTWRDEPADYVEIAPPMRGLVLPLATAWVRAFNQAELAQPCGVWAILRPPPWGRHSCLPDAANRPTERQIRMSAPRG